MTPNSNLISAIDIVSQKKTMRIHITWPKVRIVKKNIMFSGHFGSLKVIWRPLWGHLFFLFFHNLLKRTGVKDIWVTTIVDNWLKI